MTEALAHVDTAEAQFATVASEEEYESKQRDLQRLRVQDRAGDPPHNDGAHIHKLRVHNHMG